MLSSYISLTVSAIEELAPDFKMLSFSEGHSISYEPGQYLTLIDKSGNHEIRRSYSILSIPNLNEPLTIGVKRIENGHFSRKLIDKTKIGDTLICSGVGGFFKLPENIPSITQIVLFAAGSGITPVYSLIKSALYSRPELKIVLFYSNRSAQTTALYEQLKSLQQLFSERITIYFLFSSSKQIREARLSRDILLDFLQTIQTKLDQTYFYTCGPETYMMKVMFVLHEFGVSTDRVRKEEFLFRKTVGTPVLPPDKASHSVTIHINSVTHKLKVEYPDSILQAAKKKKIALPYSCETGKCGNCAARCLKGKVWMSNNEVLTNSDLLSGLTLTCVGHPVEGDVELQIRSH